MPWLPMTENYNCLELIIVIAFRIIIAIALLVILMFIIPILIGSFGFLGFGIRPPFPEWGSMINDYRPFIFISPITVIGPALALSSLVVSLNLFTEGLARLLGASRKEMK